ncbi:MAG: helix-turn-helix domain-containing protein [Kiritimatiellae bacterium]|jgi:DNA-binding IclR family transcriptional regulator|nr:helix-turn-helix domain-containing protein [Kiritimatiellia bacterium]
MANSNLIQSVQRCLDILIEVGGHDRGITLRDLAVHMKLKTPTTHNLVRTLKSKGFIQQQPGARYVLGPALFELTFQHQESLLTAKAEKTVRSLFHDMNQKATITFTEVIGGEIQTSLRMSPDQPAIVQKPRRQILNPYASATAVIFHAYASEEEKSVLQERYPFQEYAGMLAPAPGRFADLVKQTREQGYAVAHIAGQNRFAVAAPALSQSHELLAILGLSLFNPDGRKIKEADKPPAIEKLLAAVESLSCFWVSLPGNRSENSARQSRKRRNN